MPNKNFHMGRFKRGGFCASSLRSHFAQKPPRLKRPVKLTLEINNEIITAVRQKMEDL